MLKIIGNVLYFDGDSVAYLHPGLLPSVEQKLREYVLRTAKDEVAKHGEKSFCQRCCLRCEECH